MSTVFLLTKQFPYGRQEAYLFAELEILKQNFEKIVLIPHDEYRYKSESCRVQSTDQVEIVKINENVPRLKISSKIKSFKKAKYWYKVDLEKRDNKEAVIQNKNQYFIQMKHSFGQAKLLKEYITQKHKNLSQITLYNYWLHRGVILSSNLSDLLLEKEVNIVSRAHSYDVYHDHWFKMFEGADPKFLPFLYHKLNSCNKIYPISKHAYDFIHETYGVSKSKLQIARLGVADFANPLKVFEAKSELLWVTCSWITDLKRIYLMPEIISKMDKQITWVHFGSGGENDLEKLDHEIKKYHLQDRCILKGNVAHHEIMDFYKSNPVDLFLNLSIVEGIPVALMEAASFGIPMVGTDTVGTPEIVSNQNGFLVPVDFDVDQLVIRLKSFFESKSEIEEKRKASRMTYENEYCAEKNYFAFAKMLKE